MRSAKLDPAVKADLDAVDAALRGDRHDPEVAIITHEARAAAEPLPPGLALRLEAAIAEGFPKPARRRGRGWMLAPAAGVVGAGIVAVVIGLSSSGGGIREDVRSGGGEMSVVTSESSGASEAAPPVAPEAAVTDDAAAPNGRRVQRAAELTITTPIADLQDTSDEVTRTTDRLGGYVQRSDVYAGDETGRASFDLRIPAERLDDALATLSKLGHVQSRTQQSEDITARFTSARSRLRDARAERQALLRALAAATTEQEIDSLEQRLEIARGRIAAAKADLFAARRAANLARVSVTVLGVSGDDEAAGPGGDRWTPGRALEDAVDVLSVAAGVLIVGLAGAIPAALLALLALLAWRARARHRREGALDTPRAAV